MFYQLTAVQAQLLHGDADEMTPNWLDGSAWPGLRSKPGSIPQPEKVKEVGPTKKYTVLL
jgi:hypothetical protein